MEIESEKDEETIDSKYIIIEKKGFGLTANVFLVREPNSQKCYAAKVLKNQSPFFQNEIDILNILKTSNNPNIINIINSGEGIIKRKEHPEKKLQYLILDYASKGELFNYLFFAKSGLSELHSKLIFAKILKGIQSFHNMGICHRDIKIQNILLDENYSPKICDFGFATKNTGNLNDDLGSPYHRAPEIIRHKSYDGFKVDIFSLGVVLLNLNTCKFGFGEATRYDIYYRLIMTKNYDLYWESIKDTINGLSQELKNLYLKMVSYKPSDRPTIEEILNSEWMKEIKEMNNEQINKLENEIKEEFIKREPSIIEGLKKEMEINAQNNNDSSDNRGIDDDDLFDLNLKPKYAKSGFNMNNYIKLKGDIVPHIFMNNLINQIKKEFFNKCEFELNKDKCKFNVTFAEELMNEEIPKEIEDKLKELGINEEENEDDNMNIKRIVIQIKIYESLNKGYLVRFVRKEGDLNDYYDKLEKIYSLIEKL